MIGEKIIHNCPQISIFRDGYTVLVTNGLMKPPAQQIWLSRRIALDHIDEELFRVFHGTTSIESSATPSGFCECHVIFSRLMSSTRMAFKSIESFAAYFRESARRRSLCF